MAPQASGRGSNLPRPAPAQKHLKRPTREASAKSKVAEGGGGWTSRVARHRAVQVCTCARQRPPCTQSVAHALWFDCFRPWYIFPTTLPTYLFLVWAQCYNQPLFNSEEWSRYNAITCNTVQLTIIRHLFTLLLFFFSSLNGIKEVLKN